MRCLLAITLAFMFYTQVFGGIVLLHDPSSQVLQTRSSQDLGPLSQAASTGALCAASALVPPYQLDEDGALQIESVVQHNIFNKPRAVVLLNVAGIAPESSSLLKLLASLGEGQTVRLDVSADDKTVSAGSMLQATSDVVSANPDVTVKLLDHSALKDCTWSTCMSSHLSNAAHHWGGQLHPPQQQEQQLTGNPAGSLALPGVDTRLDMSHPSARLYGMELAGLQGASQQVLEDLKQQKQEGLTVYESTFVGLQSLAALHPPGSEALAAAGDALMGMLGRVAAQLNEVYENDILYQVSLLGDAPVTSGDASHLMAWKEASRRVLLERTGARMLAADAEQASQSKSFANKATGFAVTLILIWFTFAGIYCMVTMKFKQDTLLYGRSKAD